MTGYEWDCPNCGEHIESFVKPPVLGVDALAAERHATVERIREAVFDLTFSLPDETPTDHVSRILDGLPAIFDKVARR